MRTISKRDIGLTNKQIALLHVAKKQLNLDDDTYRQILLLYGGIETAKYMSLEGFERVIEHFERLGFQSAAAQKQPTRQTRYRAPERDADGSPYPAQLKIIQRYFEQIGFIDGDRQQGFCRRVIKKPWPQTRAEANKIFEALKAMLARGYKPQ